jgi:hypothetical protein
VLPPLPGLRRAVVSDDLHGLEVPAVAECTCRVSLRLFFSLPTAPGRWQGGGRGYGHEPSASKV